MPAARCFCTMRLLALFDDGEFGRARNARCGGLDYLLHSDFAEFEAVQNLELRHAHPGAVFAGEALGADLGNDLAAPVSYTHLTLPTIYPV